LLRLTSSAQHTVVRLPVHDAQAPRITVQGKPVEVRIETVGATRYAVVELTSAGVFDVCLEEVY
jgi:hypothetical protein